MEKLDFRFRIGVLIFFVSIISYILSQFFIEISLFKWIMFTFSITYLFTGWYFFKGYFPGGNIFLLIFLGYLYSSVFITWVISAFNWPMANIFIYTSFTWIAAIILLIFLFKSKMQKRGLVQFIIEAFILAMINIYNFLRYL